jgi:hypothetical protein
VDASPTATPQELNSREVQRITATNKWRLIAGLAATRCISQKKETEEPVIVSSVSAPPKSSNNEIYV